MPGEAQAVAEIMKVLFGKGQGGIAPAFGQGGGGGPIGGLLGPSVAEGIGEQFPMGLLGLLNGRDESVIRDGESAGGIDAALGGLPQTPPADPLGTSATVNELPGVDSDILADVSKKKGIAGQLDKFLEGPGRYGLLGMLMGGQ